MGEYSQQRETERDKPDINNQQNKTEKQKERSKANNRKGDKCSITVVTKF